MMRAKMQITTVKQVVGTDGGTAGVEVSAYPVCGNSPFGPNGESEDNTFARYTPAGSLALTITNPELFDKFRPGQKLYVNFSAAE
jgi:hypothetical protein